MENLFSGRSFFFFELFIRIQFSHVKSWLQKYLLDNSEFYCSEKALFTQKINISFQACELRSFNRRFTENFREYFL